MFTQELGPPRGERPCLAQGLIQTLVILGLGVLSPQPNSLGVELLPEEGNIWPGAKELDAKATSRHWIHLMDILHHPGRMLSFWLALPRNPTKVALLLPSVLQTLQTLSWSS